MKNRVVTIGDDGTLPPEVKVTDANLPVGSQSSTLATHTSDTNNPHAVTKAQVGLGSVDNTADTAKPVSTATQAALNGKAASVHTHLWADLTDKPATFAPATHGHAFTEITGTATPAQLPAATSAAAGSMSATDKAKLDAATTATTASTLVIRSVGGMFEVNTPTAPTHPANKTYVDSKGFARSAGTVTVPVLAAGATTTVAVTFPASRFTVAPIVNLDAGDGRVTVGAKTTTTTGSTITICNYTAAASVAATGQWQAVQMTSGAAAG